MDYTYIKFFSLLVELFFGTGTLHTILAVVLASKNFGEFFTQENFFSCSAQGRRRGRGEEGDEFN